MSEEVKLKEDKITIKEVELNVDSSYSANIQNCLELYTNEAELYADSTKDIEIHIQLGQYKGYIEKQSKKYLAFEKVVDKEKKQLLILDEKILSIKLEDSPKDADTNETSAINNLSSVTDDKPKTSVQKVDPNQPLNENMVDKEIGDGQLGGRGKKTSKRGGASKRRLSKKEKKTRKAKRSGRKA